MKVAILPTGRTEWNGLARALARLFPDHEFYCVPTEAEVISEVVGFPYSGFTGSVLTEVQEADPPGAMELVDRAAQEVDKVWQRSPCGHSVGDPVVETCRALFSSALAYRGSRRLPGLPIRCRASRRFSLWADLAE